MTSTYPARVLAAEGAFKARQHAGFTDAEFAARMGLGPDSHRSLRLHLEKLGRIRRTNQKRRSSTGKLGRVFVHADYFTPDMTPPPSAYKTARPHHELGPLYAKVAALEDATEGLNDALAAAIKARAELELWQAGVMAVQDRYAELLTEITASGLGPPPEMGQSRALYALKWVRWAIRRIRTDGPAEG